MHVIVNVSPLQADSKRLSSESGDVNDAGSTKMYVKHPYICVMTFAQAGLLLMWNWGPSLYEIIKVESEAATFRSGWRNDPVVRINFFQDIGLSALNLIEANQMAHNDSDIRLPNIVWNSEQKHQQTGDYLDYLGKMFT
jgi:hypothetical protein